MVLHQIDRIESSTSRTAIWCEMTNSLSRIGLWLNGSLSDNLVRTILSGAVRLWVEDGER